MATCPTCGRESPTDFKFCPVCGATLGAPEPSREQRKTVTVVFCDVTGSTALGEKLDPEALRRVMARYFDEMKGAIERHGGTVEKFIGDAVMAVFGIPRVHEDDALRAVRAAAEMREALGRLNKELQRDQGISLEARIGVNTGEVVAGDPAGGQTLVTGDAVNVAARLEQVASPGEVLIGVGTHVLVRDAVVAEPVQPLTLKGKSELIPAFRLVSVAEGTLGRARQLDSPMVGRERQLGLLLKAFEGAEADRTCHLFTILGPAGVGKSRLVAEFLERLGDRASAVRGRCLPYGDGITYFPVVEIVKEAAGLADFDTPDVIESKVCAVLEGDELQQSVCARVSQLLGVQETASPDETHWAIRRFLEALARERPLVVVFDDIHWAESALLDLIEHIADLSREAPILLLSMARGELLDLRPAWGGGKLNVTTVSLEPLADEECEQLIANLLGSAGFPGDVAQRITDAAEGNPLFVEEMLSMMIDDERLIRSSDSWIPVGELEDVTIPPSILALLEARLDRLGPQERAVIERASVVGKVFYTGALEALFGDDHPPNLHELLIALVRRELVRQDRTTLPGQETYRFRHQLIRDTAYEALPKDLRASLHEAFAGWLERIAGDRIDEQEEILAYHLEQAHRYWLELGPANDRTLSLGERAALRLFAPARRASERGDHVATVSLLRRAASLLPTDHPNRAEVLYDLGRANSRVGDVRESFTAFDQAVEAADAAGDRGRAWLARIGRSDVQMLMDPHSKRADDFRAELEQALAVFEELGDEAGLAATWSELALIEWIPCRYTDAERAAELAVAHARIAGDARVLSEASFVLLAAQSFGDATPARGMRTLEACRAEGVHDLHTLSNSLVFEAGWRSMNGDFDEARRLIEQSRAFSEGLGLRFPTALQDEQLGGIEMDAGDAAAAEQAFRKSYTLLVEIGDEGHASTGAANLARVLCWLGRFEEAEGYSRIARDTAADDDLASQVVGRSAQALVLAARGDFDAAERTARDAVEMFADAQCPNAQGELWLDLAEVLRRAGKPLDAAEAVRAALALFERKENRPAAARARELLAELTP